MPTLSQEVTGPTTEAGAGGGLEREVGGGEAWQAASTLSMLTTVFEGLGAGP